jgi:uncharacterized Ntn-hydrolase superfamily protein
MMHWFSTVVSTLSRHPGLRMPRKTAKPLAVLLTLLLTAPALATWSIVVVDTRTREVGVASATCLENFNLRRFLPVIVPTRGAAAAQSLVDTSGSNRLEIWNGFLGGDDPNAIFEQLSIGDSQFQSRQYGIVDTAGRALTFTGNRAGAYAGGITGRSGNLVYAIQGNVITGQPVIAQAEAALLGTPGDMAERLMAAMEAARDMGGDGRCSCRTGPPPSCGAPPPSFNKSAHIGFVLVARRGDPLGMCSGIGCARPDYFCTLNVAFQVNGDPDPVDQLRGLFDAWRLAQVSKVDAVQSNATASVARRPDGAGQTAEIVIQLADWRGQPPGDVTQVAVSHDAELGSAGVFEIGAVETVDAAAGTYRVPLTSSAKRGRDHFRIDVTTSAGTLRTLTPSPTIRVFDRRADLNRDGDVNGIDLQIVLASFARSAAGDADGDVDTDLDDLLIVIGSVD